LEALKSDCERMADIKLSSQEYEGLPAKVEALRAERDQLTVEASKVKNFLVAHPEDLLKKAAMIYEIIPSELIRPVADAVKKSIMIGLPLDYLVEYAKAHEMTARELDTEKAVLEQTKVEEAQANQRIRAKKIQEQEIDGRISYLVGQREIAQNALDNVVDENQRLKSSLPQVLQSYYEIAMR